MSLMFQPARFAAAVLLVVSPFSRTSEKASRIDLQRFINNPGVLQTLKIEWDYPPNVEMHLFGKGALVLQSFPTLRDDPENPNVLKNRTIVPTCRGGVTSADLLSVLQVMVDHRFFDLPDKSYIVQYASTRKAELHTISVDDGTLRASRTFAVGEFMGNSESLPADFAAVEQALAKIRNSAIKPGQTCGLAPAIKN